MEGEGERKTTIIPMNFPEELVTEILSGLPVRSLFRFKCVCKSWCNRISAKDFSFLHLNNYKTSDDHLVLSGIAVTCDPWYLSIANVSLPTRGSRIVNYPLPQQHEFDNSWADAPEVCGPCNGIFCLYRHKKELILLWNPLIQDFKIIPQSDVPRRHQAIQGSHVNYTVGFGFDSETNDYKILQIVRNTTDTYPRQQQLELYSLCTNSWRKLDYASPLNIFCINSRLFTTHGKIGWLGFKRQIFFFDLSDEKFDMIQISLEGEADRRAILTVFPFRESIAAVTTAGSVPSPCGYCEFWVLNGFSCAQSRSWSKLWAFELENLNMPIGFCGNSYLVFHNRPGWNLMLYDLLNHDVVDVGAPMVRALVYKESLISISSHTKEKEE